MCLADAVVASLSLTQEMAGSSPFTAMTNILSLISMKTFRENSNTKILVSPFSFKLEKILFFLNTKYPVLKRSQRQRNSNGGSTCQCLIFVHIYCSK